MKSHLGKLPFLIVAIAVLSACSTKQNTPMTRWYHSFTAHYNTFYNAQVAYDEGCLAKEDGNQDDFTETLPVFIAGNPKMANLGSDQFDIAITKCEKAIKNHSIKRKPQYDRGKRLNPKQRQFIARREFNPFLKNAWLLMGKSQFQQGHFVEAAATFSYASRLYATQPDVLSEIRAWLARCYVELEWYYDADDIVRKMRRDSITRRASRELDATLADYYIRQQQFKEAIPYLRRTIKRERRKKLKARGYFLLAQIYSDQGMNKEAYKALSRVIRQNPPYQVAFNARIMQTEVMPSSQAKKMISRLRRMSRNPNNKEYLDQVYYAIGNIELSRNDTAAAIAAYEKGVSKGTRQGIERGVLLLKLGDVYWERKDFTSARRCYTAALGLVDKERKDYERLEKRSKVLDELEPYTAAVHLQDSVQALAKMPESERNAAIDNIIADLKRREKEARRNSADSLVQAARMNGQTGFDDNGGTAANASQTTSKEWYFYNPQVVSQGKEIFRRQWGNRKLEDDWRRSNKSVLADESAAPDAAEADTTVAATDSLATDSVAADAATGGKDKELSKEDDPHEREYYLKQLPTTPEQLAESDSIIMNALYNAGVIEKDQLEDFALARQTLLRIVNQYPEFAKMDDVLYQLFLIEGREGNAAEAERYRQRMAADFPQSEQTKLIIAANYEFNARYGKQFEDSLYANAYDAYRADDVPVIMKNAALSAEQYPNGANRAKFMFLEAMGHLRRGERQAFADELRTVAKDYPKEEISKLAGMIVKGIDEGRTLGSGGFSMRSLWSRRADDATAATDSLLAKSQLSDKRNVPFVVIMAYPLDTVDQNHLLYEVARFNFTRFTVRNFEIAQDKEQGYGRMSVTGFSNFDEAISYARELHKLAGLENAMKYIRMVIISADNLKLIGVNYTIDDYMKFYRRKFAPIFVQPDYHLDKDTELIKSEDVLPQTLRKQQEDAQRQQEQEEPVPPGREDFDVEPANAAPQQEQEDVAVPANTDDPVDADEWYDY